MKNLLKVILYKPLYNLLAFLVWLVPGHNIGVAIILLTVLIRVALIPSSKHAIEAQKKIKDLNPEIEALKKKYPDKQEQARKIMEFYKINKINPLSGCLPLLIQLPVFFILYYVFRTGLTTERYADLLYSFTPHLDTIKTGFLWVDLAKPDKFYIFGIIAGALQFIQARQITPVKKNSAKSSDIQDVLQNQALYIMPLMTVIIAATLPSALALYWIITTLFTIIQQKAIMGKKGTKPEVSIKIRQKKND